MMKAVSFDMMGSFAAFRDPSVTSNQTVYYIPSKTAIVGIVGAMIGVRRDNRLGEMYGTEFLEFFKNTKVGLRINAPPDGAGAMGKITIYTNHRSLKEGKTKPVKKEVLENPSYRIYIAHEQAGDMFDRVRDGRFEFTPYLGHAYCPAVTSNPRLHEDVSEDGGDRHETGAVILDESEPFNAKFEFSCKEAGDSMSVMIERHLHHYFEGGVMKRKVMRHWIPMGGNVRAEDGGSRREISSFYNLGEDGVVCLY